MTNDHEIIFVDVVKVTGCETMLLVSLLFAVASWLNDGSRVLCRPERVSLLIVLLLLRNSLDLGQARLQVRIPPA